jgi:hypothetical protein
MVPLGKLAVGARDKYLDRSASKLLDDMIEKGVDLQGNPIAPDQMAMLSKTRSDMIDSMNEKSGLSLNPLGKLQDMLHTFTSLSTGDGGQGGKPMSSVSSEAEAMLNANSSGSNGSSSDDQYSGGSYGVGSDLGRDPSQGPSSGQMASGGLYNKGGLIARRK